MCFRHKLRIFEDHKVMAVAVLWSTHLDLAVNSLDEHTSCRTDTQKFWRMSPQMRRERADLSCDCEKQAFIPVAQQVQLQILYPETRFAFQYVQCIE